MRTRTSLGRLKLTRLLTRTRLSIAAASLLLLSPAAEVAAQSGHAGHGHASHARRASRPAKKRSQGALAAATPKAKVATPKATPIKVVYSCPMHPEVTASAPGTCPKCRMDLEAKAPDGRVGGSGGAPSAASHDAARLGQPKLSAAQMRHVKVDGRHGESLNLYDDLVRGRTVAFNFINAPCAAPCEQAAVFRETQRRMGERLGPFVRLITVVIVGAGDDRQAVLQRMAAESGAGDAWTFVAVDEGKLTGLLDALGVPTATRAMSGPPLVIYNDSAGYSTHLGSASPVTLLIKSIDDASSKDPVAPGVDDITRQPPRR